MRTMKFKKNKRYKRSRPLTINKIKKVLRGLIYGSICLGTLTIILASGLGFYRYLLKLPYFTIEQITIIGGDRVSSQEIIDESRIHIGENILYIDLKGVREGLERHPWIKRAKVRRLFPSELEISVEERAPVALIKFREFYLIDGNGVIFKKMTVEDNIDLPIITGIEMEELLKDASVASDSVFNALKILEVLSRHDFLRPDDISEIKVDLSNGLTLYTLNGAVRIDIGNRDFKKRLSRLKKIALSLKNGFKDLDFIDLDYEKKAVVRYRAAPGFSKL